MCSKMSTVSFQNVKQVKQETDIEESPIELKRERTQYKQYKHKNGCVECLRATGTSAQVLRYMIQNPDCLYTVPWVVNMFMDEDYVAHGLQHKMTLKFGRAEVIIVRDSLHSF